MGHIRVGWVMKGSGRLCMGQVGYAGVGWGVSCRGGVVSYRGGVGHVWVAWSGSCRGGVGHVGVGWVIQGWGVSCRAGVGCEKFPLNNLICHKLGVLCFLLKNYCQLLSG